MRQCLDFELAIASPSALHALIRREKIQTNTLFQHVTHNLVTPAVKGISGCASPTPLFSNEIIPAKKKEIKNPYSRQIIELIEEAWFGRQGGLPPLVYRITDW